MVLLIKRVICTCNHFLQLIDDMANADQLTLLKKHIQEISEEIKILKGHILPNLSFQDYKELHEKYQNLCNLKALAENEMESLLHRYKVTLSGKVLSEDKVISNKMFRRKIKTEIDCNLKESRDLNLSIESHKNLYEQIRENFSSIFEENNFKIKGVVQLR